MPVIGTPVESGDALVTREYMEIVRGAKNIAQWSNKDNDTEVADDEAITAAIETATALIYKTLGGTYVTPVDPAEDPAGMIVLRRWAEILASYELVVARGMQDGNPAQADLSAQRDQVLKEMGEYVGDYADGAAPLSFDFTKIEGRTPMAPLVIV